MSRCPSCHGENHPNARYCWTCGTALPRKKTLKAYVDSLHFDSLAGTGGKGITLMPLGTYDLLGTKTGPVAEPAPVRPLEDHSWYCPSCGRHNPPFAPLCSNCGRNA